MNEKQKNILSTTGIVWPLFYYAYQAIITIIGWIGNYDTVKQHSKWLDLYKSDKISWAAINTIILIASVSYLVNNNYKSWINQYKKNKRSKLKNWNTSLMDAASYINIHSNLGNTIEDKGEQRLAASALKTHIEMGKLPIAALPKNIAKLQEISTEEISKLKVDYIMQYRGTTHGRIKDAVLIDVETGKLKYTNILCDERDLLKIWPTT